MHDWSVLTCLDMLWFQSDAFRALLPSLASICKAYISLPCELGVILPKNQRTLLIRLNFPKRTSVYISYIFVFAKNLTILTSEHLLNTWHLISSAIVRIPPRSDVQSLSEGLSEGIWTVTRGWRASISQDHTWSHDEPWDVTSWAMGCHMSQVAHPDCHVSQTADCRRSKRCNSC